MTVHYSKAGYGQQAPPAPTGGFGDDFDDAATASELGITTRPASGVEAGITYGWTWVQVDPTGTTTDDCVWLSEDRTGIRRRPMVTGGRPQVSYVLDVDLGTDLWVQAELLGVATTDDFGICLGAPSPAADLTTGTVILQQRTTNDTTGIWLSQYAGESGGSDLIDSVGFAGAGTIIRLELRGDAYTAWGDYPGGPQLTGTLPVTRVGNNRAGVTERETAAAVSGVIYTNFRCGSL